MNSIHYKKTWQKRFMSLSRLRGLFETEDRILEEMGLVFKMELGGILIRALVFGSSAGSVGPGGVSPRLSLRLSLRPAAS